jgi:large subunit ribosomal protein L25
MDNLALEVEPRQDTGKSAARRLRREGKVPGVVYGIQEPSSVTVNPKELEKIFSSAAGTNAIIQLEITGQVKAVRPVIVKELQRDAMSDRIVHADFLEIRMDQKIRVNVPLILDGESPGIKLGGILSVLLRELEVECLPNAIPSEILVDISALETGDVVHVRDLTLPADVELITGADDPIVTVIAPVEDDEATPEDEDAAEGAAPAAAKSGDAEAASDGGEKSGD